MDAYEKPEIIIYLQETELLIAESGNKTLPVSDETINSPDEFLSKENPVLWEDDEKEY